LRFVAPRLVLPMMKAHTEENGCKPSVARCVTVEACEIEVFRKRWPCSGLPEETSLRVEFAENGDLVDLEWSDGCDHWEAETSGALLALVNDCSPNRSL
jgi:hypothetical protein